MEGLARIFEIARNVAIAPERGGSAVSKQKRRSCSRPKRHVLSEPLYAGGREG